jgi:hypothetical protein
MYYHLRSLQIYNRAIYKSHELFSFKAYTQHIRWQDMQQVILVPNQKTVI